MIRLSLSTISIIFIICISASSAFAQKNWPAFLNDVKQEALNQGIRPSVIESAFYGMNEPNRKVLHLDKSQPERRLTYIEYRNTRADPYRIKLGKNQLKKHKSLLEQISKHYGVSECFIVSLWGLETSYGRFMGNFPVVYSLATLAYDDRRADFFRNELFLALHILNDNQVQLNNFHGEWAGASGQPQFLPSSWYKYAVDYDGDGRKDIWKSLPDALASIANYLHVNGWNPGEPWAIAVTVPPSLSQDLMSSKITKSVRDWERLGVMVRQGEPLPSQNEQASIVQTDGGPTLMIFNNFKVIMKWNNSVYYAGTVGYMAERICHVS